MAEIEVPSQEELEEMRSKAFTRKVALTTAIYVVLLAITSLSGNKATKEMMLCQQQASDQWSFYQAKNIRELIYKTNSMRLEMEILERRTSMKPEVIKRYEALLNDMQAEQRRYLGEKEEIEKEAKVLEADRDKFLAKDPYFDFAEVLLQISIVLASISILAVSRPVYFASIGSALFGTLLMLNGHFLTFKLPFLN
jgi:Domain of unknown function (DUF4337)